MGGALQGPSEGGASRTTTMTVCCSNERVNKQNKNHLEDDENGTQVIVHRLVVHFVTMVTLNSAEVNQRVMHDSNALNST